MLSKQPYESPMHRHFGKVAVEMSRAVPNDPERSMLNKHWPLGHQSMRTMSERPDGQLPLLERMRLLGRRGRENASSSFCRHMLTPPPRLHRFLSCRSKATRLSKMEGTRMQPKHSPSRCNSTPLRNRITGIEVLRSVSLVRWV